jgi:hypothetical protein
MPSREALIRAVPEPDGARVVGRGVQKRFDRNSAFRVA